MRHAGVGVGVATWLISLASAGQMPPAETDPAPPTAAPREAPPAEAPPDQAPETPEPVEEQPTAAPPPVPAEEQPVPFDTSAAWGPSTANAALAPPYEVGSTASAGGERTSSVAVLVNPAVILLHTLTFDVGVAVSNKVALIGTGTVFLGDFSGGGGGVGVQYFPAPRRTFHGFFMMPSLRYWSVSTEITTTDSAGETVTKDADASLVAVGCLFGYQFNWGFALRLGGGAYYAAATAESEGYEADFAGFVPALEIALGAAF